MECYNVSRELNENDPLDVNIHEIEGTITMEGFGICSDHFLNPLKVKKVNIGTLDNTEFSNNGYY